MSNHFLKMVLDDGFQGPHVEFECKADRFAVCRRRPVDKQQESWGPDDELDGGGHACWIAEWIEAVDMSECFPAEAGVPEVVAEVPITVGYDEGPIILSVDESTDDPIPGLEPESGLIEKVAKELNGWGVSPHALPVELEQRLCEDAERAIKAVGEWLMSAIPDDSADDVREALGL